MASPKSLKWQVRSHFPFRESWYGRLVAHVSIPNSEVNNVIWQTRFPYNNCYTRIDVSIRPWNSLAHNETLRSPKNRACRSKQLSSSDHLIIRDRLQEHSLTLCKYELKLQSEEPDDSSSSSRFLFYLLYTISFTGFNNFLGSTYLIS
jgi:hypothetical protein